MEIIVTIYMTTLKFESLQNLKDWARENISNPKTLEAVLR